MTTPPLLNLPHVRRGVPLGPLTTFRIGGPAEWFYEAQSAEDLARAVQSGRDAGVPIFLLGMGANILIGDGGVPGLVIHNRAQQIDVDLETGRVRAESGAAVYPDVIERCAVSGLSGLEHFVGIPSTIGGALWQNLHFLSPDRSRTVFIEEVVHSAELLTAEGERITADVDYFEFGYDQSILHRRDDIVLAATFQLAPAPRPAIRAVMEANLAWRREKHPPLDTEPSAGSIFKKIQGIGAGRLIDQIGLKGTRIGGAEISHRHANIFVNRGHATAADVRALIELAQRRVEEETGYRLEPEIKFVGRF